MPFYVENMQTSVPLERRPAWAKITHQRPYKAQKADR